ncbi:MAG: general secretion pathway protein GspK [Sedimentisphaerales bacterium]|nr:general secretion pathway protein GspK [Sedimentisphaerales bacterium]
MITERNKKGLVLVAVLWIVVVLIVIVGILGYKSRLDSNICLSRMDAVRCKWACRAGIERAIAVLNEDERETDCLTDLWSDNYLDFNDIPLQRCWFTVRVTDESGKLNINTATREQLLGLPYMTEEVADAIIDWRDTDEEPGEYGVEGGYYENLPYGYLTRNDNFRTLRELLLVRGVTEELFYGEDTNLNGLLDYNEMDGDASPPYDNGDEWLDPGWAGYLTCYSSDSSGGGTGQTTGTNSQTTTTGQTTNTGQTANAGQTANTGQTANAGQTTNTGQTTASTAQINVNTASEIVLGALLGGTEDALRTAQAITQYRDTLMYGIEDPSELVNSGIISSEDFQLIQDYITVTSNIFSIRCLATADRNGPYGATLQIEAVIDRSTSPYKILYWYQGASN